MKNDDFVLTLNHLNSRMTRIEKEISDLNLFKKELFYTYQEKEVETSVSKLQDEYNTLLSIFKYMTNLKGVNHHATIS